MPEQIQPSHRADHIGSLKRPDNILQVKQALLAGKISPEEVKTAEDNAIRSAIALQKRTGINSITDGEYRRLIFFDGFYESLGGVEVVHNLPFTTVKAIEVAYAVVLKGNMTTSVPIVVGRLTRSKSIYRPEFEYVKSLVEESEIPNIKVTMCAPLTYDFRYGKDWIRTGSDLYKSREELLSDIAAIYRAEIADLYTAGCRNIQIDDPYILCYGSDVIRAAFREQGSDADSILRENINCLNACLRDVPPDMTVGVHLCRGNFRGMGMFEASYEPIAKTLLNDLKVNRFCLEYDNERAGGFEPLAHLPKDKVAVLGLVSSRSPDLETPDFLVSRIDDAVKAIQQAHPERSREEVLNQLCISPQCGFSSDIVGNPLTIEEMEQKLKLVADVARRVWKN